MSTSEQATVTLTMGGKPYVLTPTHTAMRVMNRISIGYAALFAAVRGVDGDAMTLIVAAGTGAKAKDLEAIERAVYGHGLEHLIVPLVQFINICANGGRDPEAARVPEGKGEEAVTAAAAVDGPRPVPEGAQLLDAVRDAEKRYGAGPKVTDQTT